MWLFLLFLAVPLIEIALFLQIGGLIGTPATLLVVVLTAVVGTFLVRSQGAQVIASLRSSLDDLRDPTEPIAHGAMILFSGALLLTPGFFTDTVGFLLLIPGVRTFLTAKIRERVVVHGSRSSGFDHARRPSPDDTVLDGEYEVVDEPQRPTHRPNGSPSGWTRH